SFGGATASISLLKPASNIQKIGKNMRSATAQPIMPAETAALFTLRLVAIDQPPSIIQISRHRANKENRDDICENNCDYTGGRCPAYIPLQQSLKIDEVSQSRGRNARPAGRGYQNL